MQPKMTDPISAQNDVGHDESFKCQDRASTKQLEVTGGIKGNVGDGKMSMVLSKKIT